jgi:hypothetical protein
MAQFHEQVMPRRRKAAILAFVNGYEGSEPLEALTRDGCQDQAFGLSWHDPIRR